jgi:DNA-binding transcriptional LysR family regulator
MESLARLQAYVRTVELGSLSAAARELGLAQPTLSKAVAALERELRVRLLERTTTRLAPTEAGLRFLEHARRIVEEWSEATSRTRGETSQAQGLLRVSAPMGFGQMYVHAMGRRFLQEQPQMRLDLLLDDRFVDLVEERVDVAIRLGGTLPATAIARPLAVSPRWLVAAPRYLKRSTAIRQPTDLRQHDFVHFAWLSGGPAFTLHDRAGHTVNIELEGRYSVNSGPCVLDALVDGQGVGLAPGWMVQSEVARGGLVRVLPRWEGAAQDVRVVYPSRRYQPVRTRLFIDFVVREMASVPGLQPPANPATGA